MSTYYVAENGEVRGPFAQSQLMNLWDTAQITANAQVCLEGTELWEPIMDEISRLEAMKPKRQVSAASYSAATETKSDGVTAVLSILFPGLGHVYTGRILHGIAWMIFTGFWFVGFWPVGLVLYFVSIWDAVRGIRTERPVMRRNGRKR